MPRNSTVELIYVPLAGEAKEIGAAKAVLQVGWENVNYNVDQPLEPILFRLYIPKWTIKKLNATTTLFIVDATVAGKPQIVAEATSEGETAAGNLSPILVERRLVPSKDFTEEPEKEGQRKVTIEVEVSAESITVPANTAKCVAFLQILGLGRQ